MVREFNAMGEYPAGCSKRPSSKAAADESTGGVASVGYVEDAFTVRTKLASVFNILLLVSVTKRRGGLSWGPVCAS